MKKFIFNVYEAMKHKKENPQCYQIDMMKERPKRHYEKKLVRREFQVGQIFLQYKPQLNFFLGKSKSRWLGPFLVNKVWVDDVIEIQDPGNSHTFTVKGKMLRFYAKKEISTEKVYMKIIEP